MKKPIILGVLAALVFLAGLVVQMPATVLAPKVVELSGHRISLGEVQGTVWAGKARVSCIRPDRTGVRCGDWQWTLLADSLLEARLRWKLQGATPSERAMISFSSKGLQIESLSATLPAFYASSLDPKLEALQLGGRLHVNGKQLAMKDGQIDVRWANLTSRLVPSVNLGELTLIIVAGPQVWNIGVSSGGGPIQLSGEGQFSPKGQLSMNAKIAVGTERKALAPLISQLGAETSPGVFSLQLP